MNDWGLSVLVQYPFAIRSTRKVRGALLCDTDKGLYLLQEYTGKPERLEVEADLLDWLLSEGVNTDHIIRSVQNSLCVKNEDETGYVLKKWYPWSECSVSAMNDILRAVGELGRLHLLLRRYPAAAGAGISQQAGCIDTFSRHNRELRRVRSYLARKKQKSILEQLIYGSFYEMYDQAESVLRAMEESGCRELEKQAVSMHYIVHGAYHQHNVLTGQGQAAVINFEQFSCGCQISDLYQFLRKIMEKHNWNREVGKKLLDEYQKVCPLSKCERQVLGLMLRYPEKYWKQVNFYFNGNKSWVSEKNTEKLKKAAEQFYVRTAFSDYVLSVQ